MRQTPENIPDARRHEPDPPRPAPIGDAPSGTLIFGGTFDPIHHGHLITATSVREKLNARQVLFIPAWISPHKLDRGSASGEDRLAMLRLATVSTPEFAIDDIELRRKGVSYTYDTVAELKARNPDEHFTLILGADQLPLLHTWHRVHDLLGTAGLAILPRPGAERNPWPAMAPHWSDLQLSRLRKAMCDTPTIAISATEIRLRVAAGLPIDFMTPQSVVDYIRKHGLYRDQTPLPE